MTENNQASGHLLVGFETGIAEMPVRHADHTAMLLPSSVSDWLEICYIQSETLLRSR